MVYPFLYMDFVLTLKNTPKQNNSDLGFVRGKISEDTPDNTNVKNHSIGEFSVINKYDVETEYDEIDDVKECVNNGRIENGRYAMADDRISGEQQRSNSIGHSSGIGANNRVKYTLNSYDSDVESLTPDEFKTF